MSNKKKIRSKPRNFVVKKMIESGRKAGLHTDQKKESEKYLCREPIDIDDYEDEWDEECDYY
jgi:hypothetical protein